MAKCRYCKKEVRTRYMHELYCTYNPYHKTDVDVKTVDENIKNVWGFWNHCFLGRTRAYQPRKLKREDWIRTRIEGTECPRCGRMTLSLVYANFGMVCRSCKTDIEKDELKGARREIKIKNLELTDKFHDLLDECEKKGTCDILAAHHELLKDDNERLRTNLILDLICKNEYDDKWVEIMDKANEKLESERLALKIHSENGNGVYGDANRN